MLEFTVVNQNQDNIFRPLTLKVDGFWNTVNLKIESIPKEPFRNKVIVEWPECSLNYVIGVQAVKELFKDQGFDVQEVFPGANAFTVSHFTEVRLQQLLNAYRQDYSQLFLVPFMDTSFKENQRFKFHSGGSNQDLALDEVAKYVMHIRSQVIAENERNDLIRQFKASVNQRLDRVIDCRDEGIALELMHIEGQNTDLLKIGMPYDSDLEYLEGNLSSNQMREFRTLINELL